ncbi:aminoacyl-tRNA hydrolase [Erysipelotrichaceae bacterium OttesenSCG-928-M19]|nr:aminoacyl-tRNA hydrolase [Erysipelotrichaceae bacterium OttesenSCG-928-M19]
MKLIVGLGNPGSEYQASKHNAGFMCMDLICDLLNIQLDKNKFNGQYFQGTINNQKVILLKPLTYMNLSGEAVSQFVSYFKIAIEDILIIYDDMDTPLGKIKLRKKGSSGGQNGMKNIINHLNTEDISRLKIGISKNKLYKTRDYVLSRFSVEEQPLIEQALTNAAQAAISFINNDIATVMNKYNKRDKI